MVKITYCNTDYIDVKVPYEIVKMINRLINKDLFMNFSEFVREALRYALFLRDFKLEDVILINGNGYSINRSIRMPANLKTLVIRKANELDLTISDFVRMAIVTYLKKICNKVNSLMSPLEGWVK